MTGYPSFQWFNTKQASHLLFSRQVKLFSCLSGYVWARKIDNEAKVTGGSWNYDLNSLELLYFISLQGVRVVIYLM